MNVSVVIPTFNESSTIRAAVERAWLAGADQVVVADGQSEDDTCELARQTACDLICCDRGRGVQLNAGAERAWGEVLLFLHSDNWLPENAIAQIRTAMHSSFVQCGAFRQRIESPHMAYRLLEFGNGLRARVCGVPFGDQGIFLRRERFFSVGGFPNVPIMEDLVLMKRLRWQTRPILLPGPIHVSPRRWQQNGVVGQTVRNWMLQTRYSLGISPTELAKYYPAHSNE